MRIANNEVTDITRETAQVGCTKVTRQEAEMLLQEMDKKVPEQKNFEIQAEETVSGDYLNFSIKHHNCGWLASRDEINAGYPGSGFSTRSAFFCLEKDRAEKLMRFLAGQLNLTVSNPDSQKYVIEFRYTDTTSDWMRSGNRGANGEFDSFETVHREVSKQQEAMGSRYEYRARAV